jgi:hypothetical protein
MGTVRTHRRRRQRHARRAAHEAVTAAAERFSRLSPLEMVAEARRATPSGRAAYLRDAMEIVAARITPSVIDDYFKGSSLMDLLKSRKPHRWQGPVLR